MLPNEVSMPASSIRLTESDSVGLSSKKLQTLMSALQNDVDRGMIPGVVVMIARHGKLVLSEALGQQNPATATVLKADAIFRIYSMTKPLVSTAAMLLVDDGKIALSDPVANYLPQFAHMSVSTLHTDDAGAVAYATVPATQAITVLDLLRHTSGLAYGEMTLNPVLKQGYAEAGMFDEAFEYEHRQGTAQQQVANIAQVPLSNQPGTTWEYGLSSDILGRVVEAASGQSLSTFLDERLFKPARMVDTAFHVAPGSIARLAEPFAVDPETRLPIRLIDVVQAPENASGGVGCVSTASDYLRFLHLLLGGGAIDGVRILSAATVALMTSNQLSPDMVLAPGPGPIMMGVPGYTFGLGFAVHLGAAKDASTAGVASVPGSAGEYSWAGAAGTYFWADPLQQMAVVVMMQAPGPSRMATRCMIKRLVHAAIDQ